MSFDTYRILTPAQAQEIVTELEQLEWKQGKARTTEATGTIKRNLEIKVQDGPEAERLCKKIQTAITSHRNLATDQAIKKMMTPKFNKYTAEGEYKRHGDSAVMGGQVRTDVACTLFLSHPDLYKGGDLCIEAPDGGYHRVKGDPGTCVVYPCHMPHWVTPVTEGARIAAITWFESCYRNEEQRNLMRRFLRALKDMEKQEELRYKELHTTFGTIHSKLQRMWIEYE